MRATQALDFGEWSETLRLSTLEVYNWGPFSRYHRASFDLDGTAIIGPTGSGKTTLVDALMTLIVAFPKYNLASTGGHESDRDLESYVRGVIGQGTTGSGSHISRPAKTVTGIAATFSRPGRAVTLGAVLWVDSTSRSSSDIKKRWLVSEAEGESLEGWLTIHGDGGDRALKQHRDRTPRLDLWESKSKYLAHVRRLFDISENAFALLNRTVGLKQLDNIDTLFRDHVLDDRSRFTEAEKVVDQFQQLAEIREELETARRQQRSLAPLRSLAARRDEHVERRDHHRSLRAIAGPWYAQEAARRWARRREELTVDVDRLTGEVERSAKAVAAAEHRRDDLKAEYLAEGGTAIEELWAKAEALAETEASRQRRLDEVRDHAATAGLEFDEPSAESFDALQRRAETVRHELEAATDRAEDEFTRAATAFGTAAAERDRVRTELDDARARPNSNIPRRYQEFRSDLASELGVADDELPYVAEMVEVLPSEQVWRGAVERAIGGHRLRILVDDDLLDRALRWVNDRDNRIHVRLERVASTTTAGREPFVDSFIHKLTIRDHRHRAGLLRLLVTIDRHCLDRPEDLRSVDHGMTRQGLLSGRTGRYEKADQRSLDDGWLTGFDNRSRLAALDAASERLDQQLVDLRVDLDAAREGRDDHHRRVEALGSLAEESFDAIDVMTVQQRHRDVVDRIERMTDPSSELARVKVWLDAAETEVEKAKAAEREALKAQLATQARRDAAADAEAEAIRRAGPGLTSADRALAAEHLAVPPEVAPDDLVEMERETRSRLTSVIEEVEQHLAKIEGDIKAQMVTAQGADTGELVEVGREVEDLPDYLERLRVLEEEGLPARRERFLTYLNQSSDEGVSALLAGIDADVDEIETRIGELNRTLGRVDFETGRFLALKPQRVTQAKLIELIRARKKLATERLNDETGETHYAALVAVIEQLAAACGSKHTLWARSVLDPRHRLTFAVAVVDRATGDVVEERTSSEGGSGGEKEIIASYVLTASLAYALCPDGQSQPIFGTVVVDEAFSKSSAMRAARIIEALAEFGLHPLFVTPNKEVRLLRASTRSAILVNRYLSESKLLTMTWEEVDRSSPLVDLTGRAELAAP